MNEPRSRPRVGGHDDAALAVLAADLVGSDHHLDLGDIGERHEPARVGAIACQRNPQAPDLVGLAPDVLGQSHDHREAPVALEYPPGLPAADRDRHHLLDITDVEAEPRQRPGRA
jgi:hypothetical protein